MSKLEKLVRIIRGKTQEERFKEIEQSPETAIDRLATIERNIDIGARVGIAGAVTWGAHQKPVQNAVRWGMDRTADGYHAIVDAGVSAANWTSNTAISAANWTYNAGVSAANDTRNAAVSAANKISDAAVSTANWTSKTAISAANKTSDAAVSAANWTSDRIIQPTIKLGQDMVQYVQANPEVGVFALGVGTVAALNHRLNKEYKGRSADKIAALDRAALNTLKLGAGIISLPVHAALESIGYVAHGVAELGYAALDGAVMAGYRGLDRAQQGGVNALQVGALGLLGPISDLSELLAKEMGIHDIPEKRAKTMDRTGAMWNKYKAMSSGRGDDVSARGDKCWSAYQGRHTMGQRMGDHFKKSVARLGADYKATIGQSVNDLKTNGTIGYTPTTI